MAKFANRFYPEHSSKDTVVEAWLWSNDLHVFVLAE